MDPFAIHQNCAGAGLTERAAFFCAGQMQAVTQGVEQSSARINLHAPHRAIDAKCDFEFPLRSQHDRLP
jgi:hypothetical protein